MGKIKIKKVSPKQFANAMKKVGNVVAQYTGVTALVDSGKALAKCKPKDAKCIAMNLGKLALAAKSFVPGAGMASGIASNIAKNAIKNAIKDQAKKQLEKRGALDRLKKAVTPAEKKAAQAEVDKADLELKKIEADKALQEKNLNDANQANEQQKAAAEAAKLIDEAKKDPVTAEAATKVAAENNVPTPSEIKKADIKEKKNLTQSNGVEAKAKGGKKILGIILAVLGALLLFVLLAM